jgi:hypothetical protein
MDVPNAHEKLEPISELVTGHVNRLMAQGCDKETAWRMGEDIHRVICEGMIGADQIKVAAAQAMAFRAGSE